MGRAGPKRGLERCGCRTLRLPADAGEIGARVGGREIGDANKMDARGLGHLRQIHRAELAGADQAEAQRSALRRTGAEPGVEIHILHAALDETFFCACLRFGNKWTCACCCFSPADAATFASSPSTGTSVKVWNFRVNKLSNSARWSLCACARHCWIAA